MGTLLTVAIVAVGAYFVWQWMNPPTGTIVAPAPIPAPIGTPANPGSATVAAPVMTAPVPAVPTGENLMPPAPAPVAVSMNGMGESLW
jgi:hypothetical protein